MPAAKSPVAPKDIVGAAQRADVDALAELIKKGGDINAMHRGYRGLHALIQTRPHAQTAAPSGEQLRCFRWMLAHGADPDLPGAWPPARAVIVAAFSGVREYIDILLDRAETRRDIFSAAALGDAAAVCRALAGDASRSTSRDAGGLTALQCAAGSTLWRHDAAIAANLVAITAALLDAGADVHAKTRSWSHDIDAVYMAASSQHLELFELFLARGARPTDAITPALWNGGRRFADLAAAALAHGADVNRAEASNRPLLHDLIRWGQFPQAVWLLEHGADPNRRQGMDGTANAGWTAVHQAASRGNVKMLQAVLAAGGDPGIRDAAGRTPADIARAAPIRRLMRLMAHSS